MALIYVLNVTKLLLLFDISIERWNQKAMCLYAHLLIGVRRERKRQRDGEGERENEKEGEESTYKDLEMEQTYRMSSRHTWTCQRQDYTALSTHNFHLAHKHACICGPPQNINKSRQQCRSG